ncbi:MAG TPA: DUF2207 domain-containing protein [Woeseiaceae bacterium]|nr:DUF2207 domain-containing protein [Woeseiaceae bacterium]
MRLARGLACALLCLGAAAQAEERILDFHSDIVVRPDGRLDVTETIRVQAEGTRIQRGIYREHRTEYEDSWGNRFATTLTPVEVLRDGVPEDFHVNLLGTGKRVYFGHSDRLLAHGEHTYVYRYVASRNLGYFENHDELYWQVTGFEWALPIDTASARVRLDFDAPTDGVTGEAYTGPQGAQGGDYRLSRGDDGSLLFESTKPLSPVNGLTIVVAWPKGYTREPTALDRFGWLIADNLNLLIALAGLGLLWTYFVLVWRRHGKDPEEGPVVTRYEPPAGYSPASLRYINQMYYDDKAMSAAIVNLAVKGYLRINNHGKQHSLTKLEPGADSAPLAAGERELYDALFTEGRAITLENENHEVLGKARAAHRRSLVADYKHRYFQTNALLSVPGMAIALGTAAASLIAGPRPSVALFAVLLLMVPTLVFFTIIMKRPTLRGRALLDELMGFRDYLDVAEKDEMNLRNPPEKTPALFEAYLPYALALGVDQAWAEKFAAVLAGVRGPDGQEYQPAWYSGRWSVSSLGTSTSRLTSGLASAVSSSVSPPGSSSGSGGGGFSGGGGGGGGGGGW